MINSDEQTKASVQKDNIQLCIYMGTFKVVHIFGRCCKPCKNGPALEFLKAVQNYHLAISDVVI